MAISFLKPVSENSAQSNHIWKRWGQHNKKKPPQVFPQKHVLLVGQMCPAPICFNRAQTSTNKPVIMLWGHRDMNHSSIGGWIYYSFPDWLTQTLCHVAVSHILLLIMKRTLSSIYYVMYVFNVV